ncbi:MAG: cell division protein FtsL [Zetaproteobacteria bacterium]|nr:MAG: cell division protein FtsL [Zetaproteobacteria bacterium]
MMGRERAALVVAGLMVALLAGVRVWVSHARYDLARQSRLRMGELSELRYRVHQLRLERTTLIRPERLRVIARDRLGMVPPAPDRVIGR